MQSRQVPQDHGQCQSRSRLTPRTLGLWPWLSARTSDARLWPANDCLKALRVQGRGLEDYISDIK